ncbi:uncharacterized protein LOC130591044 [Beta vulgaris subsp. vulgaris]|uniref:uncharacterized protein LOC130591044 n=1 Tax=Beta vulgaris subsp. vulgaris TaxID=3555 RepID=UPI002546D405|nr:uncharacterized protein LOC130591044 [Beta vulgaris subsp. vulgaris]
MAKHVIDCSGMSRSYRLHLDSIHRLLTAESSPANFILVVEKLIVLESLMEENFCQKYPYVLVTGCGQPDILVCALVDFNSCDFQIMRSYKVGSFKLAHESYRLTVPNLNFVGLSGKDLKELGIANSKLTHMGKRELRLARSLRREAWVEDGDDVYNPLSDNID